MRISYSWLKEFIPDLPAAVELAAVLPIHGLEVEAVIDQSAGLGTIVVGEVLTVAPHPQADKLQLTTVSVGHETPLNIVCGAPNVRVGMKVAVAGVGTTLPSGMTIESRSIRGQKSEGMLCAEDELGLGANHDGLLELSAESRPGQSFVAVMGLDDTILDVSIPSNRADLLSVRGLAREIAATLQLDVRFPADVPIKVKLGKSPWKVGIDDQPGVQVFGVQGIRDLTVGQTPEYIVRRLRVAGIRSVNAIVDITNYVMLEFGQPMHAYDADLLHGHSLHGRRLKTSIALKTLDGIERTIPAESLVITDEDRVIGIAGIMGGQETAVQATTKHIVLEAAIFDGPSIRRSARGIGLQSEASKRFERGLWIESPAIALQAARQMIQKVCGGTFAGEMVISGTTKKSIPSIVYSPTLFDRRVGVVMSGADQKAALERFGYLVKGTKQWTLKVPYWRLDVHVAEDVIDDLGRVVGYETLPEVIPALNALPEPIPENVHLKDRVRHALVQLGATEVILHATYGQSAVDQVGGEHLLVENPLDQTQFALRKSLLPGLERVLVTEVDAGHDACIFEIGRVFSGQGKIEDQPWMVGIGLAIKLADGTNVDWEMNGRLTSLQQILHSDPLLPIRPTTRPLKGRTIVVVQFPLPILAYGPPLTMHTLSSARIERDITLTLPIQVAYARVQQATQSLRLENLKSIFPIAILDRDQVRRLTIRCIFEHPDHMLTKEEIDGLEKKLASAWHHLGV